MLTQPGRRHFHWHRISTQVPLLLLLLSALLLSPTVELKADTAVILQSCAQASKALIQYDQCRISGKSCGAPPSTAKCWDFETGALGDSYFGYWSQSAPAGYSGIAAFGQQPTYGDNVRLDRVGPANLRAGLSSIGGDYWNGPYPIGHQGDYWIGTYENRRSPALPWGRQQLDTPMGILTSPSFTINRDFITFLIGGGCDASSVVLIVQVYEPLSRIWRTATDAAGTGLLRATGTCSELMERKQFYTDSASGLQGRIARIQIKDLSSGHWGHINVDHIQHTNTIPNDLAGMNRPVWGLADTHTHPASNFAFRSLGNEIDEKYSGYIYHGGPGWSNPDDPGLALTTAMSPAQLRDDMGDCPGTGHGTNHEGGERLVGMIQEASLGFDYHNTQGYRGDGSPDFWGWPYWWSRGHHQMHVSWIKRAYDGGLRLMVAAVHNNEALGQMMRDHSDHPYTSDYGSIRRFAIHMQSLARANSSWMMIATSPRHARNIIRSNRLAVVLATEVDNLGDFCSGDFSDTVTYNDWGYSESTCSSCNPWPVQAAGKAARCSGTDHDAWERRVDNLYQLGYRLLTPIHLADNELGGTAIYNDLFNASQWYLSGRHWDVSAVPDIAFRLAPGNEHAEPGHANKTVWCRWVGCRDTILLGYMTALENVFSSLAFDLHTPAAQTEYRSDYIAGTGFGHQNVNGLLPAGETVLGEMRRRGMIIDVTHMSRLTRDRVLGLRGFENDSILNPSCDMQLSAQCRSNAYPVVSSHAPLGGAVSRQGTEAHLRHDEVLRIRDVGGLVGPGTGGTSDGPDVETLLAAPSGSPLYVNNVTNNCAGSSRTYAQTYMYALRAMGGKGVSISTDFGLEGQPNPRFGGTGCYARGNQQLIRFRHGTDGAYVLNESSGNDYPINYNRSKLLASSDICLGTAQCQSSRQSATTDAINYTTYGGTIPAGITRNNDYRSYGLGPAWSSWILERGPEGLSGWGLGAPAPREFLTSFSRLSPLASISPSVTGNRTFDYNIDGLAHYGMLPDFLQDLRTVGMTQEQLGVSFRSAEDFIKVWEKSCKLSDPAVNEAGCW